MNKNILALTAVSVLALAGCNKEAPAPVKEALVLDTMEEKVSYAIGTNFGSNIQGDFAFSAEAFEAGINDARAKGDLKLTDEEMQATMQAFQTQQREMAAKKQEEESTENKAAGEAFLAENAKKEGVITTESGLQYKVITEGEGEKPKATDTVKAHYKGTLLNGDEFDSSYSRGEPATFGVSNLIPGWIEALQLMPVGSKWELYIPSDLAYGDRAGGPIPAGSALTFELELLEIVKPEEEKKEATE